MKKPFIALLIVVIISAVLCVRYIRKPPTGIRASYSFMDAKPTLQDELPRDYEVKREWWHISGIGIDSDGNRINLYLTERRYGSGKYQFSVNDKGPIKIEIEQEPLITQEDDTINIGRSDEVHTIIDSGQRTLLLSSRHYIIDLTTTSEGTPMWYGREQGQMVGWGEGSHFGGFDVPIKIEGTIKHAGKTIDFEGYGVYEHSWSDTDPDIRPNLQNLTWVIVNTPRFYGIFYYSHKSEQIYAHACRLGFKDTNESYRCDGFNLEDLPSGFKFTGTYDKGSFDIETNRYGYSGWHAFMTSTGSVTRDRETILINQYATGEVHRK